MKLDLDQILTSTRKKRVQSSAHTGPHCYSCIKTPNGHDQYICTLPKCTHSLNIARWIIGKENLCGKCFKNHIVDDDRILFCEDCKLIGES